MTALRRIQFPAGVRFDDYTDYQGNYMNYRTGWLIPNTEVWSGGDLMVRINSLGCKGPELTPGVPVIGVFGDSTTFCAGPDAWASHTRVPGYQTLNCGIEGHDLTRLCERYQQLQPSVDFAAVIVAGSWHNLVYNRTDEDFWTASLDTVDDDQPVAVCTLATALVPACRERGLDDAIKAVYANNLRFASWGNWPTTPEKTRDLYDGMMRYNDFVRAYCERRGRILIDLYEAWRPASYEQMGDQFMDPAHHRTSLYPDLGRIAAAALAPHLIGRDDLSAGAALPLLPMPTSADDDALHRNIYPLW